MTRLGVLLAWVIERYSGQATFGLFAIMWACSLLWTYQVAQRDIRNAAEAAKVPLLARAIELHNEQAVVGLQVERQATETVARTDQHFQKLDSEVLQHAQAHPIATDCSIDADGLRIWLAANSNADSAATGQPDGGLRDAAGAGRRDDAGPAGQPRSGGPDVPPLPGPAQRAENLAGENP